MSNIKKLFLLLLLAIFLTPSCKKEALKPRALTCRVQVRL